MMFEVFSMLISARGGQVMENGTVSPRNYDLIFVHCHCALPQRTGARGGAVR